MKECRYRKRQCNEGHFSRVYGPDEVLPRRCPICNQPYNRDKTLLCYEDGTVPDTPDEEPIQEKNLSHENSADNKTVLTKSVSTAFDNEHREQQVNTPNLSDTFVISRRRNLVNAVPVYPGDEKIDTKTSYSEVKRSDKRVALFTDGHKIEIPEQGAYLGREELGSECFVTNPFVSRKHAYVEEKRSGLLYIKDEDSLNGTYIDDGTGRRRLKEGETVILRSGDKLWLANQIIVVQEDTL